MRVATAQEVSERWMTVPVIVTRMKRPEREKKTDNRTFISQHQITRNDHRGDKCLFQHSLIKAVATTRILVDIKERYQKTYH